jgi:two-component system, cell cycle sensor histidine kinase and response regulator CckA
MGVVQQVEQLFRDAPDIVVTGTFDGTITGINRAGERLTGYSSDEVVGKPVSLLVAPEHVPLIAARLRERAAGAHSVYEVDALTKEGGRIPVEISATTLYEDGRPVGSLAIARDLRDRRAIEEQLHQAHKMEAVGRLGRVVAHDFNNVLLVMRGYGELIAMRLEEGHPARAYADKIVAEAERSVEMTRRLLAFSRESPMAIVELELERELEESRDTVAALLGPAVDLELALADEPGTVRADPAVLQQIVLNLAANARDAMPDGGRLTIETRSLVLGALEAEALPMLAPGRYRLLRFADTGTGMDAATRERAFEPMFTTKPPGEGTGLGLSIVYRLVQQLGGAVTLRSEPREGTTFSLYLAEA